MMEMSISIPVIFGSLNLAATTLRCICRYVTPTTKRRVHFRWPRCLRPLPRPTRPQNSMASTYNVDHFFDYTVVIWLTL